MFRANATNFVEVNKLLKKLQTVFPESKERLTSYAERCSGGLFPPRAPNCGKQHCTPAAMNHGRVTRAITGDDSKARMAGIKIPAGAIRRPRVVKDRSSLTGPEC